MLTVKAVLGSGRSTVVSSDGFSIDTTAPVPDPSVFFYMDTANGEARPVTKLMASNSTIQVIYGCNDNESSIVVSICCPVDFCLSASVSVFLSFCLLLTVPKQWRLMGQPLAKIAVLTGS